MYQLDNELHPWHKPSMELTLSGNYNLRDKIVARADIFYIGKRYARAFRYDGFAPGTITDAKELAGVADINLGFEYRYTKILSAFLNFNNIGAFRYYRWDNYPTQRFNLLGGIAFSF